VRREDLDLNCGGTRKTTNGEWVLEAYMPQAVATRLSKAGYRVQVDRTFARRLAQRQSEVGEGDRFQGGRSAPPGVGRKE
jgi:hypothetical protein